MEAGEANLGAEQAGEPVSGPGAFVMAPRGMADVTTAILEKPVREMPLPVRAEAGRS
jgi:hypothetical protein